MKERYYWLDYVKAIACILVVIVHTAAPYLYGLNQIPLFSWNVANYFDSFCRIAVPLFFMVSGYLFFGDRSPKFRHYSRIIYSLLFYSALALLYLAIYRDVSVGPLLGNIVAWPVFYHLWFFYEILIVYLLAGFITTRNMSLRSYLILAFFCFILFNPKLSDITNFLGISFSSRAKLDGKIIYYLLYAASGAILGRMEFNNKRVINWLAPLLYLLSSLFIAHATFVLSTDAGKYMEVFYFDNGPLVLIGSISIFLLIKANADKLDVIKKPLQLITNNSLAIYGFHPLFIDLLSEYRDYENPFLDIGVAFLVIFTASLLCAALIRKLDRKHWVT